MTQQKKTHTHTRNNGKHYANKKPHICRRKKEKTYYEQKSTQENVNMHNTSRKRAHTRQNQKHNANKKKTHTHETMKQT